VPCSFLPLFIHIDRHAGPQFHGELILVDGDFFGSAAGQAARRIRPGRSVVPEGRCPCRQCAFSARPARRFLAEAFAYPRADGKSPRRRPHSRLGRRFALKAPPAISARIEFHGKFVLIGGDFFGFRNGFNVPLQGGGEGALFRFTPSINFRIRRRYNVSCASFLREYLTAPNTRIYPQN